MYFSQKTMIIIGVIVILVLLYIVTYKKSEKYTPSQYEYNLYVSSLSTIFKFEDIENLIRSMQLAHQPSFNIIILDNNIPSPYHARLMISKGYTIIANEYFCENPSDIFTLLPEMVLKYTPSNTNLKIENSPSNKCYIEISPIITTLSFSLYEINLLIRAYQIIGSNIEPQSIKIVDTIPAPYTAKIIRINDSGITIGKDILFGKNPTRFCYQINSLSEKVWDPTY